MAHIETGLKVNLNTDPTFLEWTWKSLPPIPTSAKAPFSKFDNHNWRCKLETIGEGVEIKKDKTKNGQKPLRSTINLNGSVSIDKKKQRDEIRKMLDL